MPRPVIKQRTINQAIYQSARHNNASTLQAEIIARRTIPYGTEIAEFLNPDLSKIDPSTLKDINKAATRIMRAISMGEVIGIVCDFDVDGVASSTILYDSLVRVFGCNPARIKVFQSYRMKDGYGLTESLMERIRTTTPTPTLIITADQGSKDAAQITAHKKWAKKQGIISDIIVTDHHDIDEDNLPLDAYAFINPKQPTCDFESEDVCGAVVALMLMSYVRKRLVIKGYRTQESMPQMGVTIPLAAIATIADCSNISAPINRAFVRAGIRRMNSNADVCWRAFRNSELCSPEPVSAQTIGLKLSPLINAASRMDKNALLGVKFFLSDTDNEAQRHILNLKNFSKERKEVHRGMFNSANIIATQILKKQSDKKSICIYQPAGNHGIHGIVAAAIAEKHSKPTIIFAPKSNKRARVSFGIIEKDELNIDIFKKMEDINCVDIGKDQYIEVKKVIKSHIPVFTLYSTFSGSPVEIKQLTIGEAAKMTKKNLFKGLGKREHTFESRLGNLILDLNNLSNPTLYLEGVDELIGSARAVHGVSIKSIFERIGKEYPDVVIKCSEQDGAGSATIKLDHLQEFSDAFEECTRAECAEKNITLQACYYSDGELPKDRNLELSLVDELNDLEPFGVGFPRPAFEFDVTITKVEQIDNTEDCKLWVQWERNSVRYSAIWPKLAGNQTNKDRVVIGARLRLLCEIGTSYPTNNRTIQLSIVSIVD